MAKQLASKMREQGAGHARRARRQAALFLPLMVAVFLAFRYRSELFGLDTEVRLACVVALIVLGWAFARDLGRALGPLLLRRVDPGTAGTVSFLIRLTTLGLTVLLALRLGGLRLSTLAVGGAITAVVVGLAAQQTFGNLFAGTVLLSARPFRVGDVIRLQSGSVGGEVEGTVSSLGLLYTTLARGADTILVPNSVVLAAAIIPLREPSAVELRAELPPGVLPSEVQALLDEEVATPTRAEPHIDLEEVDSDRVVVRIAATPRSPEDGAQLADEVLAAVGKAAQDGDEPAG
jgi:small conductance mechanosensitive channel